MTCQVLRVHSREIVLHLLLYIQTRFVCIVNEVGASTTAVQITFNIDSKHLPANRVKLLNDEL